MLNIVHDTKVEPRKDTNPEDVPAAEGDVKGTSMAKGSAVLPAAGQDAKGKAAVLQPLTNDSATGAAEDWSGDDWE